MDTVECKQKSMDRIIWLDILKGLGIILVLIGHIYKNDMAFQWIYSFHMPVFFYAAGYVYKIKPPLEDLKRRTLSILLPYFIFGCFLLLYYLLIERKFRDEVVPPMQAILGMIIGTESSLYFNVHLWFLPCFFVTVVTFNILMNALGEKYTIIAIVICSCIYALWGNLFISLPWGIDRVPKYIFFYAVGYLTKKVFYSRKGKHYYIIIGATVLFFEGLLSSVLGRNGFAWYINALIGICGLIIISISINSKVLQLLGKSTIVILCFHGPIYRVFIKIVSLILHISTDTVRENVFYVFVITTVTLSVCVALYQFIIRYTPFVLGKQRKIV